LPFVRPFFALSSFAEIAQYFGMDNALAFVGSLFTDAPYIYLSWPAVLMIVGWLVAAASKSAAQSLAIVPRTGAGLVGIVTAPFVHANFAHLAANFLPFLVLGFLVLQRRPAAFVETAALITVVQGVLVWLCARKAAHVGMSGVIFGFFGYLLTAAWYTRATPDLLAAAGVLVFYGGMLAGVAPARGATSWEGHLFGLLTGIATAWFEYAA
jgi:membrane associated rhomboid family serine protease